MEHIMMGKKWQGGVQLNESIFQEVLQPLFCCHEIPEETEETSDRISDRISNQDGDTNVINYVNDIVNRDSIKRLMKSGIPGIGQLLTIKEQQRCLLVNAVDDDPSCPYNHYLLEKWTGHFLYGLQSLITILQLESIMIAVNVTQRKSVERLIAALHRYRLQNLLSKIKLLWTPSVYPAGNAQLLERNVSACLSIQTPLMVDAAVVIGVYDFLYDAKRWTKQKILIRWNRNHMEMMEVPLGMKVCAFVDGGYIVKAGDLLLIDGGLMAGKAIDPMRAIVHDGMKSLICVKRVNEYEQVCSGCGRCQAVCPVGLMPLKNNIRIERCLRCGCCSFICPSRRRLEERVLHAKNKFFSDEKEKKYIYLKSDQNQGIASIETGYSAPYIRQGGAPFTCILPAFKL